ncbi:pre-rRNA-processing protein TSR2 [Plasmodium gonderi]|uniref:Pre-rRNA-processing protein TSR2 n=1 Tax=Plasmodium gonderi TaxID=77519 RepID=A0A1Y1JED3_PLAGO|nr:pre-rRNA-processing protein TSR2 [Plasmodium gonderi]GAW79112.1 pre-rRNA-processing protein TSR2 [Plasmodium gonderi]
MNDDGSKLLYEGINLIFEKWTVLRLAVTHNWGGPNSEEKKKKLIEYVHSYILSTSSPKHELCNYLRDEMNTLFNVDIEDDSDIEVSELILDLYSNLKKNNLEIIEKIKQIKESDLTHCRENNLIQEGSGLEEGESDSDYSEEDQLESSYSDEEHSVGNHSDGTQSKSE